MTHYRAAGVLMIRDAEILLVHQKTKHHVNPYWSLPGGTVEENEDFLQAAKREVSEETGLFISDDIKLLFETEIIYRKSNITVTAKNYLTYDFSGEVQPDDPGDAVLDVSFFSFDDAIDKLSSQPWPADGIIHFLKNEDVQPKFSYEFDFFKDAENGK